MSDGMATPTRFDLFFQLTKVDEATRTVAGRATQEIRDKVREIMDYDTSVPNFKAWSEAAKERTSILSKDAQSMGNMREMHQPIAAGKVTAMDFNDSDRAIDIVTKVADDGTWQKILDGVLTGFSVGGSYGKRWPDPKNPSLWRYTAVPEEISYVDAPAVPTAVIKFIKADGSEALFKGGLPMIATPENSGNPASDGNMIVLSPEPESPVVPKAANGEVVEPIPSVGDSFLSPNLIDSTRAVEPIGSPRTEPVEKVAAPEWVKAFTDSVDWLRDLVKAASDDKAANEAKLKAKGAQVGIARKDGEPLTPPKDYPTSLDDYGDPANYSWPYDTAARVQSALSYFNGGKGRDKYSDREWNVLGRRIATRASKLLGAHYQYSPKDKKVQSSEANKMSDTTTLSKVDLGNLLSQVQAALGVAADEIGRDPAKALSLLMDLKNNIAGQTDTSSVDTSTSMPSAPTGSQAGATDTTLKAAGTVGTTGTPPAMPDKTAAVAPGTTPSSSSSSSSDSSSSSSSTDTATTPDAIKAVMEKVAALEGKVDAKFDAIMAKLAAPAVTPVLFSKNEPINDLAALLGATPGNSEEDTILTTLMSGDRNALKKAAALAGSEAEPDYAAVNDRAREAVINDLSAQFLVYQARQGIAIPDFLADTQTQ